MELKDLQNMVLQSKSDIATLHGQVEGMEHRVKVVEKTTDILVEIQKSLAELTVESRNNGEKMNDLKLMMKDSNAENKKQHDDICSRVDILEAKPGKKWESATWIIISVILTSAITFILARMKVFGG